MQKISQILNQLMIKFVLYFVKLRFYMKKNKLLTTTIGSFPKPKYIPIRDWFDSARDQSGMNCPKVTSDQTNYLLSNKTNDEHLFRKGISEVIYKSFGI